MFSARKHAKQTLSEVQVTWSSPGRSKLRPLANSIGARHRDIYTATRRSARCQARPETFYRLCDDGLVPLICPTSNVFADKASMPATHATLHGVVFDILVGSEHSVGLAAVFPDDDRRMACRGAARGCGPSTLSLRSSYAGHASPPGLRVAYLAVARGQSPPSPVGLRRGSLHSLCERRLAGPAGLKPAARP
jgi:hypothetical protein